MGFLLQGTISKPPPELEKNYICPLQMPCYSGVIPVVETGHAGSREARGFQSPPQPSRPRNIAQIKRFSFSCFEQKKNRWSNKSPIIQRKWAFSDLILCTVFTARRERGNSNQLNAFSASSGSQQPLNLCPDHQPRTPCLFRRADLLVVCPDPTGTWKCW